MTRLRRLGGAAQETVLTIVACLGAVALLATTLCLALDLRVLAFESGSMSPTISTGSMAITRSVPAAELERSDVVSVLTATGSRVTHRIVGIEQADGRAVLKLQGDGNRVPDAASYPVEQADRVLFSVPLLGYAGSALTSAAGLVGLGLLVALLVAVLVRESARPRHRGARSRALVVAILAVGVAGPPVLAGRVDGTLAAFTDPVTSNAGAFTAGVVPTPAPVCGQIGAGYVEITWPTVAGATSYTVFYGPSGGPTKTATATYGSWLATESSVTPMVVWVVANRAFLSTTWTSAPSPNRNYLKTNSTFTSTCK